MFCNSGDQRVLKNILLIIEYGTCTIKALQYQSYLPLVIPRKTLIASILHYFKGNDQVFDFLKDVYKEIIELFPYSYIHIGGDEAPKTRWKHCPKCQSRIKSVSYAALHTYITYS